jgi:hypothetical protein
MIEANPERFEAFFAPLVGAVVAASSTHSPHKALHPEGVCGIALLSASGQVRSEGTS